MAVQILETDKGYCNLVADNDSRVVAKMGGSKYSSPDNTTPPTSPGWAYKFALAGGTDTGGGILSFQNPESYDLIIEYAMLDVTTVATGACTVSIGETGTNGTTLSSNLISGQDVHSATVTVNSGAKSILWPAGKWLTVSTASGASAGLVGAVYVNVQPR